MTETEFNLIKETERLRLLFNNCEDEPCVDTIFERVEEVQKEFIRLLKKICGEREYMLGKRFEEEIDKLAGDKLK